MSPLPSDQDRSGRSFDSAELANLAAVLDSGILFAPKGTFVKALEDAFAEHLGVSDVIAAASGTAAIHTAIAALDPEPGDEVVTSSVTDIGALTPILYQGAIPVFADVDAGTGNVDAASIEDRVSERTRAIVVTHLFGNPCDMGAIMNLAARVRVPVIEDCAQAFSATFERRPVGTFGAFACFSLQQGKHITAGEGGLIATSDPRLARRSRLFVNKAWDYDDPSDHDFLALNYRMTELQGAVALAQLEKLASGTTVRRANARRLDAAIADVAGVARLVRVPGADPSFWRYCLLIDDEVIAGGPTAMAAELRTLGIPSAPRYIQKPAFRCGLFVEQKTFGSSRWPFSLARPEAVDYSPDRFPGTFKLLERILVLPWNERFTDADVDRLAEAIRESVRNLTREAA
jgi:perosamine synthetase